MEVTVKIFIYIHAFFGGLGLISGLGSILVKKGNSNHKKLGKLFSISMITSCLISLVIACLPNHENPFLFLIGLFTVYLVISGKLMLSFKSKTKEKANTLDKTVSAFMLIISAGMILFGAYGLLTVGNGFLLFVFFGGFGVSLSIGDFLFFRKFEKIRNNGWLSNHVSKMVGAFIASVTAFIVAGIGLGSFVFWIVPTIIGSFYIAYWKRKLKIVEKRK